MLKELMQSLFCFPATAEKLVLAIKKMYEKEISCISENVADKKTEDFPTQLLKELLDESNITAWKLVPGKYHMLNRLFGVTLEGELEGDDSGNSCSFSLSDFAPEAGFSDYYAFTYRLAHVYLHQLEPQEKSHKSSASTHLETDSWFFSHDYYINNIFKYLYNYKDIDIESNLQSPTLLKQIGMNSFLISRLPKRTSYPKDVLFYCQELRLILLMRLLLDNRWNHEEQEKQYAIASKYAILAWGERFYYDGFYQSSFSFVKETLDIEDPKCRQNAFNIMGICALENNHLQLAYDIYLSWIFKQTLFCESQQRKMKIDDLLSDEEQYRNETPEDVAVMFGNFAYACGKIYDSVNSSSSLHSNLIKIAKYYIEKAIELDPNNNSFYCSAGTIYSDDNKHDCAVSYYQAYQKETISIAGRTTAARCIANSLMDLLLTKETFSTQESKLFNENVESFLTNYSILKDAERRDAAGEEEYRNGRSLFSFLSALSMLPRNMSEEKILLVRIERIAGSILSLLKRTEYSNNSYELHYEIFPDNLKCKLRIEKKGNTDSEDESASKTPIAYYTKMSMLRYLFDERDPVSGECLENSSALGQNRLTVMHERYMNDPEEGLVLLNRLKDILPKKPTEMRDELLDQKYVFLKSFTELIDTLNMWTLYGSDKDNGKDCNGCCICVAPETFDLIVNQPNDAAMQSYTKTNDDYHLYKVAYMKGEELYLDGKKHDILTRQYQLLKKQISLLQSKKLWASKNKGIIINILMRSLERIMFLFKEYSYSMEMESRLVLTRDIDDDTDVKMTNGIPPRLYIMPPFQLFIEKIILGPKIENPDRWIPFLQKELNSISKKWCGNSENIPKPVVRKSSISIRE